MAKNQPHRSDRKETHREDQPGGQTQRHLGSQGGVEDPDTRQGQGRMGQGEGIGRGQGQGGTGRGMGTSPGGVGLGGGFSEERFEEESIGALGAGREFDEEGMESDEDESTKRRQQERSDA